MLTFVANGLSKRGYDVQVYTYEGTEQNYPIDDGVVHITEDNVITTRWIRRILQVFQIKKVIKRVKPDIVISFLIFPNLLSILATAGTKTPVIISERADPYQDPGLFSSFFQFMYRFADGVVFQTDGAKNFFRDKLRHASCVIPNPVTIKGDWEPVREREKKIAFVARFEVVQKRQDLMLSAFRQVVDAYPEYKLVFYGDGPDEEKVRAMTEELKLSENVVFAGVTKDVCGAIRASRMFVLTSDYEGIPNALIEAMAVGLPVIATDCSPGGARMLIEDKRNGLLVPRGDVDAIAAAMKYLIENEQTAEEYGLRAREIVDKYTPDKFYHSWSEYICKVKEYKYGK